MKTERITGITDYLFWFVIIAALIFGIIFAGANSRLRREVDELEEAMQQLNANAEEMKKTCDELHAINADLTLQLYELQSEAVIETVAEEAPAEEVYPAIDEWGYDFDYVVRVVGAEARGEPFEGIMAVAQCIRTTAERTGQTPEQVVKVPGQYASPVSKSCTDNMETVNEACLLVFGQGQNAVDDTIEYFCSTSTNSAFHNSLRYVCTIGGHNFYSSH